MFIFSQNFLGKISIYYEISFHSHVFQNIWKHIVQFHIRECRRSFTLFMRVKMYYLCYKPITKKPYLWHERGTLNNETLIQIGILHTYFSLINICHKVRHKFKWLFQFKPVSKYMKRFVVLLIQSIFDQYLKEAIRYG